MNTFSKQAFDWIKRQLAQDYEKDNDPKNWRRVDNGNPIHINPETHKVDGGIGGAMNGETANVAKGSQSKGSWSSSHNGKHKRKSKPKSQVSRRERQLQEIRTRIADKVGKRTPDALINSIFSSDNLKKIDNANTKTKVADVLSECAESLAGYRERNFDGIGKSRVYIDEYFISEIRAYIFKDSKTNLREAREIAKRQLFGLSKLFDLIENGRQVGKKWTNNPKHHPDKDFYTVIGEYQINGKPRKLTLDISKGHGLPESSEKKSYNINSEGNKTFGEKLNHLGVKANDAATVFRIVGFSF